MSFNDRNSPPLPSPNANDRRRSSFSASALAEMFSRQPNSGNATSSQNGSPAYPGPITSAAAQAQRRRLSLTTLGLSGNPNQSSPFNTQKTRTESFSSNSTSGVVDESPFEDDASAAPASASHPFARRLSFGARALRDRQNNGNVGNTNGRPSIDKSALPPPTAKGRAAGDGYNVAESMRTRAERGSISGPGMSQSPPTGRFHERAKSVATIEPPKQMPKSPQYVPDAFQERILKGDFYMD